MTDQKRRPWMKWFPADWRAESRLKMVSRAARSLWMDILGLMHEAEPYGHLIIGGVNPSPKQLAALLGDSDRDVKKWLKELEEAGVFSRDEETGAIVSRRMIRDKQRSDEGRNWKKGLKGTFEGDGQEPSSPPSSPPSRIPSTTISHKPYAISHKPESSFDNPDPEPARDPFDLIVEACHAAGISQGQAANHIALAGRWRGFGLTDQEILDEVRALAARKPVGAIKSLGYFTEALEAKGRVKAAEPKPDPALRQRQINRAVERFKSGSPWPADAGPPPGDPNCEADPDVLAKHGYPPGARRAA